MTVCIDTNVLLQARAKSHPYGVILDGFARGRFDWLLSTSILLEYEEIIRRRAGEANWNHLLQFMEAVHLRHRNLVLIGPAFRFRVILSDSDDNAFTDCAITAHADYVITSDRDFAPLANAGYKPQPITPEAFIERYRGVYV